MNLSLHFPVEEATRSDTATRLSIDNTPSDEILGNMRNAAAALEAVRELLDAPIQVTSWYRCLDLEKRIGGSMRPNGHSSGWCIDFRAPAFGDPLKICKKILAAGVKFDQLIYEGTWVHISFHPAMRQMSLTAVFAANKPTVYKEGIIA